MKVEFAECSARGSKGEEGSADLEDLEKWLAKIAWRQEAGKAAAGETGWIATSIPVIWMGGTAWVLGNRMSGHGEPLELQPPPALFGSCFALVCVSGFPIKYPCPQSISQASTANSVPPIRNPLTTFSFCYILSRETWNGYLILMKVAWCGGIISHLLLLQNWHFSSPSIGILFLDAHGEYLTACLSASYFFVPFLVLGVVFLNDMNLLF